MPPFSLASEPTRATVSSHFPKCARGSPPSSPAAAAPAVGVERIRRHSAAIERYGSSEYESLGKGKGSNVNPSPVRTKRSQKFWEFKASREGG